MISAALLALAGVGQAPPVRPASDLMDALNASTAAEIYIVRRGLEFPMRLQPEMVRSYGCEYRVYRESPQWQDFERSLATADVRVEPAARSGEVRVGLVLSDQRGTVREVYSNDLVRPNGRMAGFDQRRQVEISASFVAALQGFVARHPDLARSDSGPSSNCPREAR
jgi:hypothetical protein